MGASHLHIPDKVWGSGYPTWYKSNPLFINGVFNSHHWNYTTSDIYYFSSTFDDMTGFRQAFSLPKSAVLEAMPPGTVKLYSNEHHESEAAPSSHLQLSPMPSKDPADPLNWSKWRKFMALFCVSLFCFLANVTSASLSSALSFLAMSFNPPVAQADLGHLIAVNVLMFGAANIWWVPLSNVFGRRPVILFSLLILTACSVWAAEAKSFNSLLAARVFQGIGGATSDSLCPGVIGEIFFRHERGRAMAIYTVFLTMGPIVGGIIGSYIAAAYGWRWTQWLNVILSGATLLSCTLFLPETFFDRDAAIALDLAAEGIIQREKEKATVTEKQNIAEYERVSRIVAASHPYQPYTFARSLRVGLYSGNFVQNFLAPWKTLRLPAVWLVMLHYGGLVGGIVTISTVGPQFVAAPPYNWGANAGLINIGGLIGSIAGALATFFISDRILKRHAFRHSHGFSEPESRLPALFPGLFLATMGLLTFGMCEQYVTSGAGWVGLEVGYGMLVFGVMQVPSIGFNYIIESYPLAAHDCFVMITCLRAIIGFAWTFFVGTWVERRGAAEPFGIFCMLMGIFGLLTIPIYFYGKRIRIATEKWFPSTMA